MASTRERGSRPAVDELSVSAILGLMLRGAVVLGGILVALLGCREEPAASVPTDAELAALSTAELTRRFEAVERSFASRGLGGDTSVERAEAGHRALVAYRRHPGPELESVARRILTPAAADRASGGASCEASRDLAELERSAGHDTVARGVVEQALDDGVGGLACRESLRQLGSALGLELTAATTSGRAAGAAIVGIDVLGASGSLGSDLEGGVRSVRLVVGLDADARGELIPAADQSGVRTARLRFEGVRLGAGLGLPRAVGAGGLLRITSAEDGSGLDLVLAPGAVARGYVLSEPVRWVVDVERAVPADAARAGAALRLVVLDPGHGGDEHGARVDGVRESHLVLDIAARTAAALRQRLPDTRVLLTRTTDDEVSLEQRSALANALDADLFVSIHLNDSDVPVQTGGITTFVLDTADDAQARRLAARENATTTDRVSGLAALLAGLHRETQVAESRRLASFVHQSTLTGARSVLPRLPDRGVRSAMFYVLVGTRMPSILLEASFMTRPEELAALRTEPYRQVLAQGIAEGIVRYAATRR